MVPRFELSALRAYDDRYSALSVARWEVKTQFNSTLAESVAGAGMSQSSKSSGAAEERLGELDWARRYRKPPPKPCGKGVNDVPLRIADTLASCPMAGFQTSSFPNMAHELVKPKMPSPLRRCLCSLLRLVAPWSLSVCCSSCSPTTEKACLKLSTRSLNELPSILNTGIIAR